LTAASTTKPPPSRIVDTLTSDHNYSDRLDRTAFGRVIGKMPIAVFVVSADYTIIYANRAARDIVRLSEKDLRGKNFMSLVSPEQRDAALEFLHLPADILREKSMSVRLLRRGVRIPAELSASPWGGKEPILIIYVCDLSRSVTPLHSPMEKTEAFRIIVEESSVAGLLIVDDKFKLVYVNDRFAQMLGVTPLTLIGKDFRNYVHPDDIGLVAGRYVARQQGMRVPPVYEFRAIHSSGKTIILRIHSTTMMGRDGRIYSVAHVIDVTDEVVSRQLLEESERKYRVLIETATSGISVDDPEGKIILVNSALCAMLGYHDERELIGQPITKILHGWTQENIEETLRRRMSGLSEQYEAKLKTRTGETIPVVVSASPLYDSEGRYAGSVAIFTDISALKEAEAEVHFLLDLLMHDVGNQLQLVLAGTDLLDMAKTEKDQQAACRYIHDGVARCLEIISKVRRAEETKVEPPHPVNLSKVLLQECELLERQLGVRPMLEGIPRSVMVRADSALGYLLRNVLENAVKHNPKNEKMVWVTGRRLESTFEVCIADNGPGLSDTKKRHLFDPGRRFGGVGLHLVTKMARKYGGMVTVEDRVRDDPSQGLKVCISFPLVS